MGVGPLLQSNKWENKRKWVKVVAGEISSWYHEKFLCWQGGQALPQAAQRSSGIAILGSDRKSCGCSSICCSFKCAYQCNNESLQKSYFRNPTVDRQLVLNPVQEMILLIPISMLITRLCWFSHWLLGMLDFLLLFLWEKLWWRYPYIIIWKWGRVWFFLATKVAPWRRDRIWNHVAFISPFEALWQKPQKGHFQPQNQYILRCPVLIRQLANTNIICENFACIKAREGFQLENWTF